MEKKYILISVLVAAAVIVSVYSFWYRVSLRGEEFKIVPFPEQAEEQLARHKQDIRQIFEFTLLSEEAAEQINQIAQSDEVVHAILQVLDEPEGEIFKGPVGSIAVLKYTSEDQWNLLVTVNTDTERVESITASREVIPLVLDPKRLMQIAEREVPVREFGRPILRKVTQAGEDAEVVFLTDEGVVTVKLNLEKGEVTSLVKEFGRPFIWWPVIMIVFVLAGGAAIVLVDRKRRAEKAGDAGDAGEGADAPDAADTGEPGEGEP